MGTGYTRQSAAEIDDGLVIEAVDLENEFDAIQAAFNATTGHSHDGTTGEGPKIDLVTSVTGRLPVANGGIAGIHKLDGTTAPTVNEDSNDGYVPGSLWVDTTNDVAYLCLDGSVGAAIWQRYQPYDAELLALAGLTSAADKLPYFTGSGTAALADFPAYGRAIAGSVSEAGFKAGVNLEPGIDVQAYSANLDEYAAVNPTSAGLALLDDADAAAQLTTLGISAFAQTILDDADAAAVRTTIGAQASDAELTAIAGLTSAADKGIQFTGSGTAATFDLTTAGKALLDDANASAQRTTLGLAIGVDVQAYDADTAKLDVADQVITGGARVTSLSDGTKSSGTYTPDPGDRPLIHITNGGAFTLAPGSNTGSYILDITNNGSAGTITTSGWTKVTGDDFTTTNAHKFRCFCSIGDVGSLLNITAMQ
jgi:hypothetical protein